MAQPIAALIVRVAADMSEIKGNVAQINDRLASIGGAAKSAGLAIAGAFGASVSIGAVVNFGKSVINAAGQIADLADQIGVSAEAVQGFKFAAEQGGSSIEGIGTAITKMNQHLAGGDKGTIAALTQAGLRFADIRALKPEDAFLAITDAIKQIPDPMIQTHVAMAIFGKSAAELLPAIKEGIRELSGQTSKWSNDTIRDLDEAEKAWDKLGNKVTIWSGKLIAEGMKVLDVWSQMKADADRFGLSSVSAPKLPSSPILANAGIQQVQALDAAMKSLEDGFDKQVEAVKKATAAANQHAEAIKRLRDTLSGNGAIKAANDLREALAKMPPVQKLTGDAQAQINSTLDAALKVYEAAGTKGPKWMRDLWAATYVPPAVLASLDATRKLLGDIASQAEIPHLSVTNGISHLREEIAGLGELPVPKLVLDYGRIAKASFGKAMYDGLDGLANGLSAAIAGSQSVASAIKAYATNVAKDFAATMLSFIPGIGPILSKFAGPIVDGLKKLFGGLFGLSTAGRDLVKSFAGEHGGFDALHAKLATLGAEGERLWIALTQGVGRNNPEQARKVIDEITAAWERNKTKVEEAAEATANTYSEAVQKAKDAVSALDSKIKGLYDSIANEAPEEVMGIIEQQTRAQIAALEEQRGVAQQALDDVASQATAAAEEAVDAIDTVLAGHDFRVKIHFDLDGLPSDLSLPAGELPGFAHGTNGYQYFGSGTPVMLHGWEKVTPRGQEGRGSSQPVVIHVHSHLDRRQIAEAVAETVLA